MHLSYCPSSEFTGVPLNYRRFPRRLPAVCEGSGGPGGDPVPRFDFFLLERFPTFFWGAKKI